MQPQMDRKEPEATALETTIMLSCFFPYCSEKANIPTADLEA